MAKAYRGIIPDDNVDSFTPEKRTEVFKEVLATRPEEFYLFRVGNRSAGIALLHKSHEENATDSDGEIYAIYFHPDFWETPATHEAFQFCIDRLKERDFTKVTIWILEKNIRARKFYEKYGFTLDDVKKQIDLGIPLIEVRYSKEI